MTLAKDTMRVKEEYLLDNPDNLFARRPFKLNVELLSQGKHITMRALVDSGYTGAYSVIDEEIMLDLCSKLDIVPRLLNPPRPLRGYDGKLTRRPITQVIYPHISINGHKESSVSILITPLGQHNIILGKP